YLVHRHEADVVAVAGIARPRIAEPDQKEHGALRMRGKERQMPLLLLLAFGFLGGRSSFGGRGSRFGGFLARGRGGTRLSRFTRSRSFLGGCRNLADGRCCFRRSGRGSGFFLFLEAGRGGDRRDGE